MPQEEECTMDELIKLVSSKVGISEEQARQAVQTVIGYVKDQLPAPIATQVEAFLGGSGEGADSESPVDLGSLAQDVDLGSLTQGLGGLLGKK
jgi:uncharacterized protein (DUF2267 family)